MLMTGRLLSRSPKRVASEGRKHLAVRLCEPAKRRSQGDEVKVSTLECRRRKIACCVKIL